MRALKLVICAALARPAPAAVGLSEDEVQKNADAGDYASEVCMANNPRTREVNRMCEAFALHWDLMVHDLDDVCEMATGSGEINPSTWLQCAPIRPLSTTIPRRASSVGLQLPFRPKTSEIGRDTAEI